MTGDNVVPFAPSSKRQPHETPESYTRMCEARRAFLVAYWDWLGEVVPTTVMQDQEQVATLAVMDQLAALRGGDAS